MSFLGGDIFSEGKQAGGFFWEWTRKNLIQLTLLKADSTPFWSKKHPWVQVWRWSPGPQRSFHPVFFFLRVQKRSRWKCQKCGVCYLPYKVIQGALCPYCDKMHVYPAKNQRWQFKVHIYFLAHARRRMKFPLKVLSSNRWYLFFVATKGNLWTEKLLSRSRFKDCQVLRSLFCESLTAMIFFYWIILQGTNISPTNGILKMIFLFLRWDMLMSWRVINILILCLKRIFDTSAKHIL